MADETIADLVTRVRRLVADPAGAGESFSNAEVEDALNGFRMDAVQHDLSYQTEYVSGQEFGARYFYSGYNYWASDTVIVDVNNVTLTPDSSDPTSGVWRFTAVQKGLPLRITGRTFDLFGAAAELLRAQAAKYRLQHDVSLGDVSATRSQKIKQVLELAQMYENRRRVAAVVVDTTL